MSFKTLLRNLIFMVLLFSISGCETDGTSLSQEERNIAMKSVEMTEQEMQFLKEIYIDEERIETGSLYSYQKTFLLQYRFASEYLNEKYPSYAFTILRGEPMSALNSYARFFVREKEGENIFEVHVMQREGDFQGEDNFYGEIIREEYDDYLYKKCIEKSDSLMGIYSIITGVKGIEYNEEMRAEDIISGEKKISPLTEIYFTGAHISEDQWNEKVTVIKETVQNIGLYGSYILYYVADTPQNELTGQECHIYVEEHDFLYKDSFQNFN